MPLPAPHPPQDLSSVFLECSQLEAACSEYCVVLVDTRTPGFKIMCISGGDWARVTGEAGREAAAHGPGGFT